MSLFPFVALEFLSMKQHSNFGKHIHNSSFISASKCLAVADFVRGVKAAKWAKAAVESSANQNGNAG